MRVAALIGGWLEMDKAIGCINNKNINVLPLYQNSNNNYDIKKNLYLLDPM